MSLALSKSLRLPTDQDISGRSLGDSELANLSEVLSSGVLTSTKGKYVKQFQSAFAEKIGVRHAFACSSGTSAIHAAIAAIDPDPGDEIVTSPITDMGALTPILYQGAIPVFAEVDPRTWNVTAKSIEEALGRRTRAIMVTHLFGNPCDMAKIVALADARGIPVIEDCAQALLASSRGQFVGSFGKMACFSLQQGKHITTGEGGIVVTNDDATAHHLNLFLNKGWDYEGQDPDHEFLALNYRMSELQGAVAAAQMPKLGESVRRRIETAGRLTALLADIPEIQTPFLYPESVHTYWKYCLRVNEEEIAGGCLALGRALKERNIYCVPRYIQKPAFGCRIFREQKTLGSSRFPFNLARPEVLEYGEDRFPATFQALRNVLVLPWNENYQEQHVAMISEAIHNAISELRQ